MQIDDDGNWAAPSDNFWECYQEEYGQEDEFPVNHPESPGWRWWVQGPGNRRELGEDGWTWRSHRMWRGLQSTAESKPSLPGTKTEWHKNGGKTFGKRKDIFERIRADPSEDGEHRRENNYYPFQDKRDYEIG